MKWFGAYGDSMHVDTTAIQNTFAALSSTGGSVYFPAGTYLIASVTTVSVKNVMIFGDGPDVSVLTPTSSTMDLFDFTQEFATVRDLGVSYGSLATSGIYFNFSQGNCWMTRVFTTGGYNIVAFSGTLSTQTFIADCIFSNFVNNGVSYLSGYKGFAFINGLALSNSGNANTGVGILLQTGDTFTLNNINVNACAAGLELFPPTGTLLKNVFCTNILCDGAGRTTSSPMWIINGSNSGANLARVKLTNCWAGTSQNDGFQITAADDVTLTNCIAIDNNFNGINLNNPVNSNVRIEGCTICGNSLAGSALYSGILIGGGTSDFIISGCRSGPVPEGFTVNNYQAYGIVVGNGASMHYIIVNNNLSSNVTGGLLDGGTGTNKVIGGNLLT